MIETSIHKPIYYNAPSSTPPDEQTKRPRPDDMDAMKMTSSQRMTSPHHVKEEHMTSQADSTDDLSGHDSGLDPQDNLSPLSHHMLGGGVKPDMGGVKRLTPHDLSPIPSPTQCQYGGNMSLKSSVYGSSAGFSTGSDSVYYPHHQAHRLGGTSFLPAATSSPLIPSINHSINHALGFSSHGFQGRLGHDSGSPSDCALRQGASSTSPTSSSTATSSSNMSSGYGGLRPSPHLPSPTGPAHNPLSSCTYMQPSQLSQPGYPSPHLPSPHLPSPHLAANMHMMNMNFPGQLA